MKKNLQLVNGNVNRLKVKQAKTPSNNSRDIEKLLQAVTQSPMSQ